LKIVLKKALKRFAEWERKLGPREYAEKERAFDIWKAKVEERRELMKQF
jgi:hypothetical protein